MEASRMKNIVVLKNLPSNIVDEAIVILKQNKKIKNLEFVDKSKKITDKVNNSQDKEYILKEAEMVVSDYMDKNQNESKKQILNKYDKVKYKRLKKYSIITTIALWISLIINLI